MFLRVGLHVIETQTILIAINLVVIETSFSYHRVLVAVNKIVVANLVVIEKVFNCYPMIIPFCKVIKKLLSIDFWWSKNCNFQFCDNWKGFHLPSNVLAWLLDGDQNTFLVTIYKVTQILVATWLAIETFFCCWILEVFVIGNQIFNHF